MASCPSCNSNLEIYKAILLFSVKKVVTCSKCETKLSLNQGKMLWLLGSFYGVGFLMGTHMYRNDFSLYSILLFTSFIIVSAVFFSKHASLKVVN